MNTPSNATPESSASAANAPARLPATQLFYWLVRRELWENRSIYLAPLAAGGLFLFGFMISLAHLPAKMRAAAPSPDMQRAVVEQSYDLAALMIMGTTLIVAIFYCLDALYAERRDRSILFWKSLPVSDLITVLSKAIIPIFILPVVTFVVTIAVWCIMLVLSSAALLGNNMSGSLAGPHLPMLWMSLMLLYHLVCMHGLWYAPMYGWLLLVSAWARRAAFLWAAVPLLAIGILEKLVFNTSHFANMLGNLIGGGGGSEHPGAKATAMSAVLVPHLSLGQFFSSPGLWIGLAITALFLAVAVQLRRNREPL